MQQRSIEWRGPSATTRGATRTAARPRRVVCTRPLSACFVPLLTSVNRARSRPKLEFGSAGSPRRVDRSGLPESPKLTPISALRQSMPTVHRYDALNIGTGQAARRQQRDSLAPASAIINNRRFGFFSAGLVTRGCRKRRLLGTHPHLLDLSSTHTCPVTAASAEELVLSRDELRTPHMNSGHPDSAQTPSFPIPGTRPAACVRAGGSEARLPVTVDPAELEQAGQFLRRAMIMFETDRRTAWRCLIMASTILTDDLNIIRPTWPVSEPPSGLAHWQAKRVVDYIEVNLESNINVDMLARLIALSKGHFSRAFKKRVGVPPMAFIVTRRIERAKTMLISTREPIANIAAACGFGDQAHLTRRFCRAVGVTPGRYRRINSDPRGADQERSLQASTDDRAPVVALPMERGFSDL